MKKTLMLLCLCIATLTSTLASCSSNTGTTASDTTTASADNVGAETTAAAVDDAPIYTAPDVDYEGAEFRFYTYNAESLATSFFLKNYDGMTAEPENGDILNDAVYQRNQTVQEELNCVIVNTPWTKNLEIESFTKNIYASDDVYDIALGNINAIGMIGSSDPKILVDLHEVNTLDLDSPWWDDKATAEYEINGFQFTTTGDLCLFNTAAIGCLYFNKEMVNTHSLDIPYGLVDDGTWTVDKFTEMCNAVSADLNGNGEIDVEDRFGLSGSNTTMGMLLYGSGIRNATVNDDGISEFTLNTQRTHTLVEKAVKLLRNKATTLYVGDFDGDVTATVFKPAFMEDRLLFHFNWVHTIIDFRDMDTDFGILPFPKYDEAQEGYHSYNSFAFSTVVMMPMTNSKYDMTGDVLDAMGYYAMEYITPAFIETSVTGKFVRDDESARMLVILKDNKVFELYDLFKWGKIGNVASQCVSENSTNFASKYDSMIEAAELALAETYATFGK